LPGRFFDLLTEESARGVTAKAPGGGRLRFPPWESSHNPYFVRDRKKAICDEILDGEIKKTVAENHKISLRHVEKILRENGIEIRKERTNTLEARIRLARKLGKKVTDIAEDEEVSRVRIYQIMKKKRIR
jgi:hypothetical protein